MLTWWTWRPVGGRDDSLTRCGSEPVTISAWPVVTIGVDAGGRAAAEAKGPGMELSAYVSIPSMRTLGRSSVGAATEHVRARV